MAVPAPISANQTAYLNNLIKGGGGNAEWAKSQLGAVPQPSATSTPKPLALNNNDGKGGLSQQQLDAMQKGLIGLGPNFGSAATPPLANSKPQGTFNSLGKAGDGTTDTTSDVTPVAATNTTPAPMSQGSFPGQLTNAQIAAEAQARIDKQRAAITGATNAANAARKNVFDYTNQITGDSRTLENGAFNETHDPFSGQTGYAQANLQRNRSIQDTANNNNYQADITANNQKLTDFETLAPEQQQAILDDLTRQERDYGLQVGTLTGQFNGGQTLAAKTADQNYQLGLSGLSGQLPASAGGGQTIQGQTAALNNQGQSLQNQLTQLKLSDYPAQSKAAAEQTQLDLKAGKISNETAQFKLEQLKDENSPINQAAKLDLELKKIDVANAPQEARLKIQQLQKQIDQIGAAPYQSANDRAMDETKLAIAKEQLKQLQNPTATPKTTDYKTNPSFAQDIAHLQASPADAQKLNTNPQPFIDAYGYDGYLALRKAAGLPDPTAP